MDAGRSWTKANRNEAKFTPCNHSEDDAQPCGAEQEYSSSQHQGMRERGKLFKKGTPIAHAGPPEANEKPTRQSCYGHRCARGGSANSRRRVVGGTQGAQEGRPSGLVGRTKGASKGVEGENKKTASRACPTGRQTEEAGRAIGEAQATWAGPDRKAQQEGRRRRS